MSAQMSLIAIFQQISLDIVALVFLVSGIAKLLTLQEFRQGLVFIPYMRESWSYVLGYSLPFIEIILAVALYFNLWQAKLGAVIILAVFCGLTIVVIRKRLAIPCNCFGAHGGRYLSIDTIKQNLLLISLTAISLGLNERVELLMSVFVAGFIILFFLSVQKIRENKAIVNEIRKLEVI